MEDVCRFYKDFGEPGCSLLPVSVNSLALFISYLSARKFASSTILTYVSALSYVHKLSNLPDPSKNFLVQKLLTAHDRLHSAPDVGLPITFGFAPPSTPFKSHQFFFSFSEVVVQNNVSGSFLWLFSFGWTHGQGANLRPLVHVEDRSFQSRHSCVNSASIVIKGFKHDTNGSPFSVNLESAEDVEFCPVHYLRQYSSLRGSAPGPLFCFAGGAPVKTPHFTQQLRRALIFCGLDSSRYKSHSFRIGASSWAAEKGLSDAHWIRHLGRWKSDAFKLYVRQPTSFC